jgi:hypothetical protein
MDAILAYAPPSALLNLRLTSREMRDAADELLWNHVRFKYEDGRPRLRAADGALLLHMPEVANGSVRTDASGNGGNRASENHKDMAALASLGARTRVMTLHGPVHAYAGAVAALASLFPSVEVLRVLPPMPAPLTIWPDAVRARTMIIFTGLVVSVDYVAGRMRYSAPVAPVPPLMSATVRAVVHVHVDLDAPLVQHARLRPLMVTSTLREVVVLLTPSGGPDETTGTLVPVPSGDEERRWCALLLGVLNEALASPHVKFTVVGADALPPTMLGLPPDTPRADVHDALLACLPSHVADLYTGDHLNFALRTLEEYCAGRPRAELALEFNP